MIYTPEIASTQEFPQDHLVKHFDAQGRIVKIEFRQSGKWCEIEYLPDGTDGHSEPRKVHWSDGHVFLTWKEADGYKFEHIGIPFTCDIPRSACCGECDRCSYRDDSRTFFPSYDWR